MSERFEDEVRSALRSGVSDELSAAGLAEGARSRLRRRRRTTMSIVGAAALVAAVPVGLTVLNSNGGGPGPGPDQSVVESADDVLPGGWHFEVWDGVEIGVPDAWRPGALDQWCVSGLLDEVHAVQRPNTMQTLVYCEQPQHGYGVQFDPQGTPKNPGEVWQYTQGDVYPHNAWLARLGNDAGEVLVVAPDQDTAQTMANSFRAVDSTDANGCASRVDVPRIGTATGLTAPDSGPIVLCTYSGTTTGNNLIGSDGLSADRAQALLDALATAKDDGAGMAMPDCAAVDPDAVLILRDGAPMGWAFNTHCSDSGVDLGNGEILPPTSAVIQALYGYAPEPSGAGSGDGGVVVENPDGSVSNDGTVVPPDQGSGGSSTGGGSSGSSGSVPGSTGAEGGAEGSAGTK